MALDAIQISVTNDMYCGDDFTAIGGIDLHGVDIDGTLNLDGATLTNSGGTARFLPTTSRSAVTCSAGRDLPRPARFACSAPI